MRKLTSRSLLGLTLLAGCNPGDFQETLQKAPVRSLGAPSGYASREVGKMVLPISVPASKMGKVTARFLIAGTEIPSLAVVELDAQGKAKTYSARKDELMPIAGESNAAVKSAVELGDGRILLGSPTYGAVPPLMVPLGRPFFLQLVDSDRGIEFKFQMGSDPATGQHKRYGLGVAKGHISGGAAEDLVILAEDDMALIEDGDDTKFFQNKTGLCDVALDASVEKGRFRAVGVGDLIEGPEEEIAIGVPHEAAAAGRVVIFRKVDKELECPVTIEGPSKRQKFGTSLVVQDIDGDGKKDLLVGSPPDRAYLYKGPFTAGMAPAMTLELKHPMDVGTFSGDFGYRVLGMDIDGTPGLEIVVSSPEAAVSQKKGAGQVVLFKNDGTSLGIVQDNSPEEEASFGLTISALKFSPGACGMERSILVVGAITEVFAFFKLPNVAGDPRCLGK
jgi:hypothetical protein